jgi:8-hydroxy-5-deazaflavin:NADPH oxidoreductase
MANERPTIGIIGGTGDLGSGLAKRWSAASCSVVLGLRSKDKAEAAAGELGAFVRGADNVGAARAGDIVVIAVPYSNHAAILAEIKAEVADKIVVDAVVPLVPPKVAVAQLSAGGSAAQIAQALLGSATRVVSAFHNVSASKLHAGGSPDCDVLVFGDSKEARETVIVAHRGCRDARHRWWSAGELGGRRGADVGSDWHQPALQDRRCRDQDHRPARPRGARLIMDAAAVTLTPTVRARGERARPAFRNIR